MLSLSSVFGPSGGSSLSRFLIGSILPFIAPWFAATNEVANHDGQREGSRQRAIRHCERRVRLSSLAG